MSNVRIGFDVNDLAEPDVSELLRELRPILTAPATTPWNLALTGRYYGPTAAVVLASALLSAHAGPRRPSVTLPKSPPKLTAFCSFSGLAHLAQSGQMALPPAVDPPASETAPLQQFHKMNWGGSTPLVRLIRRHLPELGSDSEDLLRTCYSEIVQNIEDHAQSPVGGVICGRYFARLHEIRIAVADRGVGIGAHLRRSPATTHITIRDDAHALDLVLRGNVTSKSRSNNMGQGISNLGAIAVGNGGRLMIFSGDAHAVVDAKGSRTTLDAASAFPGTLVLLSLQVSTGDAEPNGE